MFLFPSVKQTELFVRSRGSISIQWKNIQMAWINEYLESFITVSDEGISRSNLMSTPEPYKSLLISKGQYLFSLSPYSLPYFMSLFYFFKILLYQKLELWQGFASLSKVARKNEVALLDGVKIIKGSIEGSGRTNLLNHWGWWNPFWEQRMTGHET